MTVSCKKKSLKKEYNGTKRNIINQLDFKILKKVKKEKMDESVLSKDKYNRDNNK